MEQSFMTTRWCRFSASCKPAPADGSSQAASVVKDLIRDLNIKVSDSGLRWKTLSGGNAQRIAIAKWVATQPHILILDSPTVGVDIAIKKASTALRGSGGIRHGGTVICDEF